MTVLDIVILTVIAACAIYGAKQGFIRELSHIIAFGVGIFLAVKLHSTAAALLLYRLPRTEAFVAAFLGLLLIVICAVYGAFSYVKAGADKLKLRSADHTAGALLGGLQGAFICALIIFALTQFSSTLPESYLARSRVARFLLKGTITLQRRMPDSYPARVAEFLGREAAPLGEALKHAKNVSKPILPQTPAPSAPARAGKVPDKKAARRLTQRQLP